MKEQQLGIMLDQRSSKSQVFTPYYWELNLTELGYFLVQWGWVLNIKPPPYIIDEESWQLMNKINERKIEEIESSLPKIIPEENKELFKELFKQLLNRK